MMNNAHKSGFAYRLFLGPLWGLVLATVVLVAMPAQAQQWVCRPPPRIAVDLGYCYGFVESYFEAIKAEEVLDQIDETNAQSRLRQAHEICYATNYANQKILGSLAFSSYLNLKDDSLLKTTAADCSTLLEYYSDQAKEGLDPSE